MGRGRPSGPKVRCNNQWTEARFRSFIFSLLRQGTRRWAPKSDVKKEGKVSRGIYECASCKQHVPVTVPTITKEGKRKRVNNVFVDHIEPIVDPAVGFTTWDEYIERMFCEKDNLQLLCKECHDIKSKEETKIKKERIQKHGK